MPEFKESGSWANKFLAKSPWKKETRTYLKATIAKDPTINDTLAKEKKVPAIPKKGTKDTQQYKEGTNREKDLMLELDGINNDIKKVKEN